MSGRIRVLIADDHPVVRQGLKQILTMDPDISVAGEAQHSDEALALARKLEWDVAILDYSMPGRSGIELLKELRRLYPQRPVLILSAYPEELHATRVLKAGGSGYVSKDSAGENLAAAVRKVVKGGKYVSATLAEKLAAELVSGAGCHKPLHDALSDREYRVMWLLASGGQIHQIARQMFLSPSTISTYRARILAKLNLSNTMALVHYAIKNRLLE